MSPTVVIAALSAVVVWGASNVATKIAVLDLSPMVVALIRTVVGGAAALPLALALGVPLPKSARHRAMLALSGFCGFIGFPIIFSYGQRLTSATHGALILAAMPIFTGAYAMAWDRRWPALKWWLGCLLALMGEVVLVGTRQGLSNANAGLLGDGVMFASTLLASFGYVVGGKLQQAGYPSAGTTFWGVILAAIVLLPVLIWVAPEVPWHNTGMRTWVSVAYLAIGVTIIGYVLWYWALGRGGIARIGLLQFLQPISGVLLAALLLDEPLTSGLLLATAIILTGVAIAQRAR